jgi:hypothetical protein
MYAASPTRIGRRSIFPRTGKNCLRHHGGGSRPRTPGAAAVWLRSSTARHSPDECLAAMVDAAVAPCTAFVRPECPALAPEDVLPHVAGVLLFLPAINTQTVFAGW